MSTKTAALLEKIRGLPPGELDKLSREVNRLVQKADKTVFKTRQGIPLARNDGVKMTTEEIAATLSDG